MLILLCQLFSTVFYVILSLTVISSGARNLSLSIVKISPHFVRRNDRMGFAPSLRSE